MELTPELKKEILDSYMNGLGLEPAKPSREELENEIVNYLKLNNVCVLCTVNKEGVPRATAVDYKNDGMTIYIMTEGGGKIDNIRENSRVALSIYSPHRTMRAVRGINYEGEAKIYTVQHKEEIMKAFQLLKEEIESFKKEMKGINPPPPQLMKLIKITPKKVRYICFAKGIGETEWIASE